MKITALFACAVPLGVSIWIRLGEFVLAVQSKDWPPEFQMEVEPQFMGKLWPASTETEMGAERTGTFGSIDFSRPPSLVMT